MQHLETRQILLSVLRREVFPQQRIQPESVVAAFLQQPFKSGQVLEALANVVCVQRMLGQGGRDPLKQRDVHKQIAVALSEVAQQPLTEPLGGDAVGH